MVKIRKSWSIIRKRLETFYGGKYDFSLVNEENYMGVLAPIQVICPKHGVFLKDVHHLIRGQGCPKCAYEKKKLPHSNQRGKIYGHGIFDSTKSSNESEDMKIAYSIWVRMFRRCYSDDFKTYNGCKVCKDWLLFSKFKEWFDENYIDGYDLDKDILFRNNKVYSPKTCCFVPHMINSLLINCKATRGNLPIGVVKNHNGFTAQIKENKKHKYIGYFDTVEDAFAAYKKEKERYIQAVAKEYYDKGEISKRVYDALMKYEVEITD